MLSIYSCKIQVVCIPFSSFAGCVGGWCHSNRQGLHLSFAWGFKPHLHFQVSDTLWGRLCCVEMLIPAITSGTRAPRESLVLCRLAAQKSAFVMTYSCLPYGVTTGLGSFPSRIQQNRITASMTLVLMWETHECMTFGSTMWKWGNPCGEGMESPIMGQKQGKNWLGFPTTSGWLRRLIIGLFKNVGQKFHLYVLTVLFGSYKNYCFKKYQWLKKISSKMYCHSYYQKEQY